MRLTITDRELRWLSHIMHHFTDYMAYDDRPDHGMGILKGYRTMDEIKKREIFVLAGKIMRSNYRNEAKHLSKI